MAELLETELETYARNRDHLLATAEGKFVLIRGDSVVDTFESKMDAVNHGYRQFGNVPFLVKKVARIEVPLDFASGALGI